jgi:hypothetical protein
MYGELFPAQIYTQKEEEEDEEERRRRLRVLEISTRSSSPMKSDFFRSPIYLLVSWRWCGPGTPSITRGYCDRSSQGRPRTTRRQPG